jgi:hypothetical protein
LILCAFWNKLLLYLKFSGCQEKMNTKSLRIPQKTPRRPVGTTFYGKIIS